MKKKCWLNNKTAIVTGASSGLGTGYACFLDKEGLSEIWLVARRKERLAELSEGLVSSCRCLGLDLTDTDALDELADMLQEENT